MSARDAKQMAGPALTDPLDLQSLSRADLLELRREVDKAIPRAEERERRAALKAAGEAARQHGFELAELLAEGVPSPARGRKAAPAEAAEARLRNPDDPGQTWSGRSRRPAWVHEALGAGRSLEDLRAA